MDIHSHSLTSQYSNEAVERMYTEWDAALSSNDPEQLLACYAPDAGLERPLLLHLMDTEDGACRDQLRAFFEVVAERKPALRHYFRRGFFADKRQSSGNIRTRPQLGSLAVV